MAAAMLESLLINCAFVDGNKRIAFFATADRSGVRPIAGRPERKSVEPTGSSLVARLTFLDHLRDLDLPDQARLTLQRAASQENRIRGR